MIVYVIPESWLTLFFSSVQFNPTAPRLWGVRKGTKAWAWPLHRRPAGLPLTASSASSTRSNTCWRTMARCTQSLAIFCVSVAFLFCFLTVWPIPNLDWTFLVRPAAKGDQQAPCSLQRLAGALHLEPLDPLEKCNPLMFFSKPTAASLNVHNVCFSPLCVWLSPFWDNQTLIADAEHKPIFKL